MIPREHIAMVPTRLTSVVQMLDGVRRLERPRAQVLLETTTVEVCAGPTIAFAHYEMRSEPAWQRGQP